MTVYILRFIDFCWHNIIILVTMQLDLIPRLFWSIEYNCDICTARKWIPFGKKKTNLHLQIHWMSVFRIPSYNITKLNNSHRRKSNTQCASTNNLPSKLYWRRMASRKSIFRFESGKTLTVERMDVLRFSCYPTFTSEWLL